MRSGLVLIWLACSTIFGARIHVSTQVVTHFSKLSIQRAHRLGAALAATLYLLCVRVRIATIIHTNWLHMHIVFTTHTYTPMCRNMWSRNEPTDGIFSGQHSLTINKLVSTGRRISDRGHLFGHHRDCTLHRGHILMNNT